MIAIAHTMVSLQSEDVRVTDRKKEKQPRSLNLLIYSISTCAVSLIFKCVLDG